VQNRTSQSQVVFWLLVGYETHGLPKASKKRRWTFGNNRIKYIVYSLKIDILAINYTLSKLKIFFLFVFRCIIISGF
jgi:hypothetical protein